jgi:hypothetical protein
MRELRPGRAVSVRKSLRKGTRERLDKLPLASTIFVSEVHLSMPMPSYLTHFDPDVFVSYAHGDPRDEESPLKAWTQALVRKLESQIRSIDPEFKELKLWIDTKLDPTALLSDELEGKVGACGLLMIVMSKWYLTSDWCRKELEWFRLQVYGRTVAGGRVFIIRAQETDTSGWPDFLRDRSGHVIPGFPFHSRMDRESPLGFELAQRDKEYFDALANLRVWLVARLREMRECAVKNALTKAAAAAMPSASPPPTRERRIYLYAHPNDDSERIDIARELYQEDIVALTATQARGGRGLPDWLREDSNRIGKARECEALALLRVNRGDRFRYDLQYIGIEQRKGLAGARGAPMPCAVLDKTGEGLPFDVAPFGIERFDLNRAAWRGEFREWIDAARAPPVEAAD